MNKRQIQREGTLGLIYETVNILVAEKGFEQMRIKDICSRAGISTGAFYHHFSSKQDILFERYRVTCDFARDLYEEGKKMPCSESACFLIREMTEYTRTRVPDILRNYCYAYDTLHEDWARRYPGIETQDVLHLLLDGRVPDGEAIAEMGNIYLSGITQKQCASNGKYLEEYRPEDYFCEIIRSRLSG